MSFDNLEKKYRGMTADEIIMQLEDQYKHDADALEDIARAKQNIAYIKRQQDYKGQTPKQCALELAGNLSYWG